MLRLLFDLLVPRSQRAATPPTGPPRDDGPSARDVEARLLTIFGLVNEWLRFAETKNAGLAALDAIGVTAILTYVAADQRLTCWLRSGLGATSLLLVCSLAIALLSFLPRGDPRRLIPPPGRRPAASDNLYFFGDVANYQPAQLAATIALGYEGLRDYDPARHRGHLDLASQIIANARITVAKNAFFRWAASLALLGLMVAVGAAVLSVLEPDAECVGRREALSAVSQKADMPPSACPYTGGTGCAKPWGHDLGTVGNPVSLFQCEESRFSPSLPLALVPNRSPGRHPGRGSALSGATADGCRSSVQLGLRLGEETPRGPRRGAPSVSLRCRSRCMALGVRGCAIDLDCRFRFAARRRSPATSRVGSRGHKSPADARAMRVRTYLDNLRFEPRFNAPVGLPGPHAHQEQRQGDRADYAAHLNQGHRVAYPTPE